MNGPTHILQLEQLSDRTASHLKIHAGGNAFVGACDSLNEFRGMLASQRPDSLSYMMRMLMEPGNDNSDPQARMKIYLLLKGEHSVITSSALAHLQHGRLATYFPLTTVKKCPCPWNRMRCVTCVIRREEVVPALIMKEENSKLPPVYYRALPFIPNQEFDWLAIDEIAGRLNERFMLDVTVSPENVFSERAAHATYIARLEESRHTWRGGDERRSVERYLAKDSSYGHFGSGDSGATPKQDPLVDRIVRGQEQFHESLAEPNFLFSVRVFTEDVATGSLLASVLAETALCESSYGISQFVKGDPFFACALEAAQAVEPIVVPTHQKLFTQVEQEYYADLSRLASIASVSELESFLRLPIAKGVPPNCIHAKTDPKHVDPSEAIVIGYDISNRI